jgi:LysR family transcriptional regulator, transcription activator of glutamate synthase operon
VELLQLQYFRTVARLEHMTRAAEELHIAQPALSKTIARLEEAVGVPLFDRHGRQIKLNTYGKIFLEKTETALSALEEGKRQIADMAGLEQGSIYLATPTVNRLTGPLGAFLSLHPGVKFHLTQATAEEMEELLEAGRIDFGFTALPLSRPGLRDQAVMKEDVFIAVPPGHRLARRVRIDLSEVAGEPLIGYTKDHIYRVRDDELFRRAGMKPNYVCEVSDPAAKISLVKAGLGLSLVGACNKSDDSPLAELLLLGIDSPACQSSFFLVWHDKHYLSKAALAFRDFIVQFFDQQR